MADLDERLVSYRVTMSLAQSMLHHGLISEKEYRKIDTIIANKYGLNSCTIFFRKPLINKDFRANMTHNPEGGDEHGEANNTG